ncbi:hypothetical protein FGRMN_4164 [Fusarium graminum]|nr:hypothetical protein FGRMN_4164 [Fusarium graminum]
MASKNGQPGREFCTPRRATAAHVSNKGSPFREALPGTPDNQQRHRGEVLTNEYGTGCGNESLYTTGLSTCARVAVIGKHRDATVNRDDRFLAHVAESEGKAALQGLINAVEAAKANGMIFVEAIIVVGDMGQDALKAKPRDEEEQDEFNLNHLVSGGIMALTGTEH